MVVTEAANWEFLTEQRYRPSLAEGITGISAGLQRKRIERYFNTADPESVYHWRMSADGSHSRYTWAGVQTLALFGVLLNDLGNAIATAALRRRGQDLGILNDLAFDHRRLGEEPDLFLHYAFEQPQVGFTTTSLDNFADRCASPSWSSRIYLYNLSEFQRRIAETAAWHLANAAEVEPA
jgi:hypothetical protein